MTNPMGSAKVISLAAYQDKMQFPQIQEVEAYWEALRNGRDMPVRSEVDPRGLARVLEYAVVLERVAEGVARFRVAGQHLHELMGMDVRGMPFSAMIRAEDRAALAGWLAQVFDTPAKLRLTLSGERGIGRPALAGQMLILPLHDDFEQVSRALGAFVTDGKPGRLPRRFRIAQHRLSVLDKPRATAPEPAPAPGFAEGPARFAHEKGPDKRPALRLVDKDA